MSTDTVPANPSPSDGKRAQARGAVRSGGPRVTATRLTFVLALLCVSVVGYATVAYVHLSFASDLQHENVTLFIVRQRTVLSALAISIGVSCIVMGICVFMIGAKGELHFSAENPWFKGALVSGVPGPFFVLCGTVVTLQVLGTRVTHEELAYAGGAADPSATPSATASAPASPHLVGVNRTIASPERFALLATSKGAANSLFALSHSEGTEAEFAADLNFLGEHPDQFHVVKVDWDADGKRPRGGLHATDGTPDDFGGDGVLFVPEEPAGAELVMQVASRLSTRAADPRPLSQKAALRQVHNVLLDAQSFNPRQAM